MDPPFKNLLPLSLKYFISKFGWLTKVLVLSRALESKLAEQQKQRGDGELRYENENLKAELKLARNDLRNLKVQNIEANSKIR